LFNILLVLTLLIGAAAFPNSASAASTITVTTIADNTTSDGQCSLREAIINANTDNQSGSIDCPGGSGTDTITFDANYTITLGDQLPAVTTTIIINGTGAADSIIQANAAPATATYRVFEVTNTGDLSLGGLTVRNGRCNGSCSIPTRSGGGILNAGTLTVTNSMISGNTVTLSGGGVYTSASAVTTVTNSMFSGNTAIEAGGVFNSITGMLTITNSIFSGNTATGPGSSGGAGIENDGTLTVTNSTFSGNSATSHAGGIYNNGTSTVMNSTFSGNSAQNGGGIANLFGTLTVTNNTFSGNSATANGGGVYTNFAALTTVTNSTFSGNSATTNGGGIAHLSSGTLTLNNSILANSISGGDCYKSMGGTVSGSHNLIESDSGGGNACGTTAPINSDPNLGTLTGSPAYFPLNSGSLAIDAGDDAICAAAPVNNESQNGVTRPQGANCDIGSFEFLPPDTTAPTVSASVRANNNPTNLASVDFTVTFSESVTGVDTADFTLTTTGVSGASLTSASGSDATYTVSVNTGSGDGTIRLDVLDDDSILDAASNPLNGGFTGGETYNVDKNDAPSAINLDNTSVAGNLPVSTLVGTFSSTDADISDTFTYSLVSGIGSADNAFFSIAGDQLQTATVFDSAVKTSYAIRVRTTDNGVGNLFFEQAFTITVTANIVTPSLLTPIDMDALINSRPTFDWTDVLGSTNYHLQIYKAISFAKSGKVVDTTTASSTYTLTSDLPAGIILYWRVSRNTVASAGPWSVIRSFTIALPPSVPGPVSPKTNAKNVSLTPLFDWSDSTPSAGTTLLKYELQISTDSVFASPISVDAIDSNHTLTTSLNPNTKYYWRVRACNTLGQCSAWSPVRSFTTTP
jgi:CSLREA domain-containing protein